MTVLDQPFWYRFPQIASQVRCSSGYTKGVATPFGPRLSAIPRAAFPPPQVEVPPAPRTRKRRAKATVA